MKFFTKVKDFFQKTWTAVKTAYQTKKWLQILSAALAVLIVAGSVILALTLSNKDDTPNTSSPTESSSSLVVDSSDSSSSVADSSNSESSSATPDESSTSSPEESLNSSSSEPNEPELTPSEGLEFTLSEDGTYYIVSGIGTCTDTHVVIPTTYENKPVKEIGGWAFYGSESLQSVTISNSVQSVGNYAFFECISLQSVTIGNNVQSIGGMAFSHCYSLTSIEVFTGNTTYQSIDDNLYTKGGKTLIQYAMGKSATSFIIPNSVQFIGDYAFYGCESLQSVTIGNSVQSIGNYAFNECISLQNVIIGNNVQSIGVMAFAWCESLQSVTIPNSVQSIGYSAFYLCESLTEITFENKENWYVTRNKDATSGTDISVADLENKSTAATYLKDEYVAYYWKRK